MTPEELYRYDLKGYLYMENAIPPDYLKRLNERLDYWQEKTWPEVEATGKAAVSVYDIINRDEAFLDLVVNPRVLPYIDEMMEWPRLKTTWIAFKWKGGKTPGHSSHTPTRMHNFYHFNGGRIHHNLFNMFYALSDVPPGGGGLKLVPGSHKANYPRPAEDELEDVLVEIPMKAGSVLMLSHDVYHTSLNTTDQVRRVLLYTYCPGEIANAIEPGDTLYDRLFEKAPEGSWLKYLLRRPNGFKETYPRPQGRPYDAG